MSARRAIVCAMSSFTAQQLSFFNASAGAGSEVTAREHFDSQITVVEAEKRILFSVVPENSIPRGSIGSVGGREVTFFDYRSKAIIRLNVNFPKPARNELRLYLSDEKNYKPAKGQYWFIFISKHLGQLTIGAVDQGLWTLSGGQAASPTPTTPIIPTVLPSFVDSDDPSYLEDILDYDATPTAPARVTSQTYRRNPRIASKALHDAKYECEIDPTHQLFESRTGKPFVEAHHLIPVAATPTLTVNLDFADNICSLCPHCHRAIHHSEFGLRASLVTKLHEARKTKFAGKGINLSLAELLSFYGI